MTHELFEKAKEAEPVAIVTEASNMTGATVSNEVEGEAKLDKIATQVTESFWRSSALRY